MDSQITCGWSVLCKERMLHGEVTHSALSVVLANRQLEALERTNHELCLLRKHVLFERWLSVDYYMSPAWSRAWGCMCTGLGATVWYAMAHLGVSGALEILRSTCAEEGLPEPWTWEHMDTVPRNFYVFMSKHPELIALPDEYIICEQHDTDSIMEGHYSMMFSHVRHFQCLHALTVLGFVVPDLHDWSTGNTWVSSMWAHDHLSVSHIVKLMSALDHEYFEENQWDLPFAKDAVLNG